MGPRGKWAVKVVSPPRRRVVSDLAVEAKQLPPTRRATPAPSCTRIACTVGTPTQSSRGRSSPPPRSLPRSRARRSAQRAEPAGQAGAPSRTGRVDRRKLHHRHPDGEPRAATPNAGIGEARNALPWPAKGRLQRDRPIASAEPTWTISRDPGRMCRSAAIVPYTGPGRSLRHRRNSSAVIASHPSTP